MYRLPLEELAQIIAGILAGDSGAGRHVSNVSIHSKRIQQESAFFALRGSTTDGHLFAKEALQNGAVAAVVSRDYSHSFLPDGSGSNLVVDNRKSNPRPSTPYTLYPTPYTLIVVDDPLIALQQLALWWRRQLTGKVIGITGSNGKTLVKDTLHHVLSQNRRCSSSPGSFNSQMGVPLSILRAPQDVPWAIWEAGTSAPGEMERLENLIRPDYGILTNIGWAHISSFGDRAGIAAEKAGLFRNIPADGWALVPGEDALVDRMVEGLPCRIYRFGVPSEDLPYVTRRQSTPNGMLLHVRFPSGHEWPIPINATSQDVITDVEIALCAASLLGVEPDDLATALTNYAPSPTRLEVWKSPTGVTLINDSNSAEPLSVQAALRTLETLGTGRGRRIFVFGGMESLGDFEEEESAHVGALAAEYNVDILVLLQPRAQDRTRHAFAERRPDAAIHSFQTVTEAKECLLATLRWGDTLLVTGEHHRGIEGIARDIVESMTANRFYIDLQAVSENVARFRRITGAKTKILAMLKALAYGSEAVQLAAELQHMGVDCIGTSSADEGRLLRQAGVELPILVMMCTPDEVEKLPRYDLVPMIYTGEMVDLIAEAAQAQARPLEVHLEVNTGMNRLGIRPDQILPTAERIRSTGCLRLSGLMTHFAGADDPKEDDFTHRQLRRFEQVIAELRAAGFTNLLCHAGATAGAMRFPEARFDMVRIGLGLYGLYPSPAAGQAVELVPAVALVSRIVESTRLQKGDRIGYGGTFVVPHDGFRAAVVPMGYHDAIPWSLSNRGAVLVNGQRAAICGRVSMDSMVIDVTHIPGADVGAEVLIYGARGGDLLRPEEVAETAGTIVYELLARMGPRVQRIFLGR